MTDQNYTDFQTPVMTIRTSSRYEPRCGIARPCRFSPPSQRECLEWTLVHPAGLREQPGRINGGAPWREVRRPAALRALEESRYPSNPRTVGTTGSTIPI